MKIIYLMLFLLLLPYSALADERQSAFERVIKNGTLRCGYYVFPPVTIRDPNTDELSGMLVDLMEEIAGRADLKIEWTEEITFGNWAPALQSDRFDAVCTPMWPEIPMARVVAFTDPIFFAGLSPLVRADDERFPDGTTLDRLNRENVTFLAQEGNAQLPLTKAAFPKASVRAMPAMMEGPAVLQEIVTGKGDAILLDRNAEIEYNKNNPVKLKLVDPANPVKVQPFTLVVQRDEMVLKDFLDNALQELHNDGTIERLLKQWEPEPHTFLRRPQSYEAPK